MIHWLFDFWARWQADRRRIFYFRIGGKPRRFDPLSIAQRLAEIEPGWEHLLAVLASDPPKMGGMALEAAHRAQKEAATARLIEVARDVFRMPELNDAGSGNTKAEVLACLIAYVRFMGRLANAAAPFSRVLAGESIPAVT